MCVVAILFNKYLNNTKEEQSMNHILKEWTKAQDLFEYRL